MLLWTLLVLALYGGAFGRQGRKLHHISDECSESKSELTNVDPENSLPWSPERERERERARRRLEVGEPEPKPLSPDLYALTHAPTRSFRPFVEYENQKALLMYYPNSTQSAVVRAMVNHTINAGIEAWLLVDTDCMGDQALDELEAAGMGDEELSRVKYWPVPDDGFRADGYQNGIWVMDYSPIPIINEASQTMAFADHAYYSGRPLDDVVSSRMARVLDTEFGMASKASVYRNGLGTEGGTFQATTEGICFTSTRKHGYRHWSDWGLDENHTSLADYQTAPYALTWKLYWRKYLGCTDVIFLWDITNDGTGHLDMFFKAASDELLIVGEYADCTGSASDAYSCDEVNQKRMDENAALLAGYKRPGDKSFEIKRIIMPGLYPRHTDEKCDEVCKPEWIGDGECDAVCLHKACEFDKGDCKYADGSNYTGTWQNPFTYLNSVLLKNGDSKINMYPVSSKTPQFQGVASRQWQLALPEWKHVPIEATVLMEMSGALHCISRNIPDYSPAQWEGEGECADLADAHCGPEWYCKCEQCHPGNSTMKNLKLFGDQCSFDSECTEVDCGFTSCGMWRAGCPDAKPFCPEGTCTAKPTPPSPVKCPDGCKLSEEPAPLSRSMLFSIEQCSLPCVPA